MKNRGLLAAAVVLAALGGALYWSNGHKPAEDAAKLAANLSVKVLSLNKDEITTLEVKKKGDQGVVLTKSGAGAWSITAPQKLVADSDQISSMLTALSSVDSDRVIEEKTMDRKPYGLDDPAVKVSATLKSGKAQTLILGDNSPTGNSTYAIVEGDPRVFAVATSTKTNLDKGLNDLRDKRLLPVNFENISQINVLTPKLNLVFGSDNGRWVVQSPKDVRGDVSKLEGVVEKLKVASMDPKTSADDAKKTASAWASGKNFATVKATDSSGSQEIQIHKNKDALYVKSTAMEGAYKVDKELGDVIDKSIDDFREKNLTDLGAENPDKIEMRDGGKTYLLTRTGEDWRADGKKMDFVSVDSFLRAIRLLVATKFVAGGYTEPPELTLALTSRDGKKTERVFIAKNGSGYVAKRENEALLYDVDPKFIVDLQKSAADVKPAEPAKK